MRVLGTLTPPRPQISSSQAKHPCARVGEASLPLLWEWHARAVSHIVTMPPTASLSQVFAMPESKFDQAKFDKLVQGKSWLLRGFVFYAKAHWDPM